MATGRNSLFSPRYDARKMESQPILQLDSDSEDDHDESIILFSRESEKNAINTSDPRYTLLKITILRSLLDECLDILESSKRKRSSKFKLLMVSALITLIASIPLVVLLMLKRNSIEEKERQNFMASYNSTDIPISGIYPDENKHYTCEDFNFILHQEDTKKMRKKQDWEGKNDYRLLPIERASKTCYPFDHGTPNTGVFSISPLSHHIPINSDAYRIGAEVCLAKLSSLCKDMDPNGMPIVMLCVVGVGGALAMMSLLGLMLAPAYFYDKNRSLTLPNYISSSQRSRLLDILKVFNLSERLSKIGIKALEDLITDVQDIKDFLTRVETNLLVEEILPKKLSGHYPFIFSEIKKHSCTPNLDDEEQANNIAMNYWSAASKANIL